MLAEEVAQRRRQLLRVAQLAADDDAGLEVRAGDLQQLRRAVVADGCRGKLRRADLQTDELRRATRVLQAAHLDALRLRLLRLLCLLRLAREAELLLPEGLLLAHWTDPPATRSAGASCSNPTRSSSDSNWSGRLVAPNATSLVMTRRMTRSASRATCWSA